jgi:phage portal protein BeeE
MSQPLHKRFTTALKTFFRFPVYGGQSKWGGTRLEWLMGKLLPGADFDYIAEAGDLWKNGVVSAFLNFLMCTFPEPRLCVMTKSSKGEEVANFVHPALALFDMPNQDDDDQTSLVQQFIFDYSLWGNSYWLKLRNAVNDVIGFQPITATRIQPYADPTGVRLVGGYSYSVDGKILDYKPEDIIHFRFGRDPENPRKGLSPLIAACRDICAENELATLTASVARNMGIAPYFISPSSDNPEDVIEPDQAKGLMEKLKRLVRDRRGEPMISRRPVKIERLGFSPDELMADKSRAIAVSRIGASFRIDPMVIGLPSESKTYSNLGEAHKAVYDHNLIPAGDAFCTKLTRTLRTEGLLRPNERLAWNYDLVAALQEDVDALWKRVVAAYTAGVVLRKVALKKLGLDFDEKRDDVYLTDLVAPKAPGTGQNPADANDDNGQPGTTRGAGRGQA